MEKLKFAYLVSWICFKTNFKFCEEDLSQLDNLVSQKETVSGYNHGLLDRMLEAMKSGQKLEAIKQHRAMSGFGLKESKDFIEQHWITQQELPKQQKNANLGDILRQATGDK